MASLDAIQELAKGAGVELPQMLIGAKIEATKKMGDYRTSMHLDMRAGRALEVEAIFSYLFRS